jgi:hypothetical protein
MLLGSAEQVALFDRECDTGRSPGGAVMGDGQERAAQGRTHCPSVGPADPPWHERLDVERDALDGDDEVGRQVGRQGQSDLHESLRGAVGHQDR